MISTSEVVRMLRRFQQADRSDARVSLLARDGVLLVADVLALAEALTFAEGELARGVNELETAWKRCAAAEEGRTQSDAATRCALSAVETLKGQLADALATIARLGEELERAACLLATHGIAV